MAAPGPHPLARLFDPRGVAVIGASETPGKYGEILLRSLIEGGYGGAIHPINPRGGSLLGRRFLPSLSDASGPADVALIVRPAPEVPQAIEDVARLLIPFAVVYAAGFSEHGAEGARLESAVVEAARRSGTRIVGPNCMSLYSGPARLNLSSIPFPEGRLGFVSASGNLGFALAHEAGRARRLGFSRFVGAGNQADLTLADFIDFMRADPHTSVILVFAEGFSRSGARPLLEAVASAAAEKPVLLVLGGRTREGQQTAVSHTGALAADPRAVRQALEQAGAVILDRADETLAVAQAFLESPLPAGPAVALCGEGGGHATLIADAAAESGLRVDPLPPDRVQRLRAYLPDFAAILHNPVEFAGRSEYDPRVYEKVLGEVIDWPGCDQLILFGGYALYDEALAEFLDRRRRETGKPILIHDLYAEEERPAFAPLRARALPLFPSAEVTARAAAALARGGRARRRARRALAWAASSDRSGPGSGGTGGSGRLEAAALPADLGDALAAGRRRPNGALTEEEAARLLAHFGVGVLPAALARGEEDTVGAAARIGFPIVLKIHSASIVHKTEAGGVSLDLRSADEVRRAWRALCRGAQGDPPEVRVTPYLRGGVEVIAGARRDPRLGAVILFGAGGGLAEFARDVALRTIPCSEAEIEEMIGETRVSRLLSGTRGAPPADRGAILETLLALERALLTLSEVADVEVNPLRCAADGAVALDARVLLRQVDGAGS